MSKRKTITQAFHVTSEDMTFEDADGILDDLQTESSSVKSEAKSRSGRVKKVKAIYDPSDSNGPVHKRKKEALEAAEKTVKSVPKSPAKMPAVSPTKRPPPPAEVASSPKAKVVEQRKTPAEVSKRLNLDDKPVVPKIRKLSVIPVVPLVKEPSKRIQQRKVFKVDEVDGLAALITKKKQRSRSASININVRAPTSISSADDAPIIPPHKNGGEIPDVKSWSHQQVADYFSNILKFSKKDSAVFKDEEIDGETLLIMKRSDIVNTKFQQLKLGTALKMWSHIIKFQTGSDDPTQAWK